MTVLWMPTICWLQNQFVGIYGDFSVHRIGHQYLEVVTKTNSKLAHVVRMVVDSILPHAEIGPNDHRKDAPPFITSKVYGFVVLYSEMFFS